MRGRAAGRTVICVIALTSASSFRDGFDPLFLAGLEAVAVSRRAQAAVAAVALLVRQYGLEEVRSREVGPKRFRDVELGVGDLPQQKIADAHFARSADEEVGIGNRGRVEVACDGGFVDCERVQAAIAAHLYTSAIPDPDLLIRTSGEMRISNFLLWQIAYAELYVTDTLWPDFSRTDLLRAVLAYQKRDRRYGGLSATRNGHNKTPEDQWVEAISR